MDASRRYKALIQACLLVFLTVPQAAVEGAEPPATEAPKGAAEAYTRVGKPDADTVQLEIARRRFVPAQGSGPDIWLVAVSHIGETNYYQDLQAFLDRQGLVLYEGVGDPQSLKIRADEPSEAEGLQATLANSLGMAFQLDAIRYDRDHFINSDMTFSQLEAFLVKEIQDRAKDGSTSNPAFIALMGAMEGSSWLGAVLHVGAKLLGSSPKLKAMTRLMFIEILGGLTGDISEIQGLPPDMQELLQVLIHERNKVVLRDLGRAARRREPVPSVAVFYGAGHMPDLERRLREELGYEPAESVWMPAIVVQPVKAGLTDVEIKAIRSMVKWQMQVLEASTPPPTQPVEEP